MYATACLIKNNSDDRIAKAMVQGFTGQLKGWWDFHLSNEAKAHIFAATKLEDRMPKTDCVNTLICTIAKHFIGATTFQTDRTEE